IFQRYSLGVSTNRDETVYSFDDRTLEGMVEQFVESFNAEVDKYVRKGKPADVDNFVDHSRIKWSSSLKARLKRSQYAASDRNQYRNSLYRPFTLKRIYY